MLELAAQRAVTAKQTELQQDAAILRAIEEKKATLNEQAAAMLEGQKRKQQQLAVGIADSTFWASQRGFSLQVAQVVGAQHDQGGNATQCRWRHWFDSLLCSCFHAVQFMMSNQIVHMGCQACINASGKLFL